MVQFHIFSGDEGESFSSGATIFREGDPGEHLFVVLAGKVEILVGNKLVDTLGEGQIFGEMALIDRAPRSATARAGSDCRVASVDERRFQFLVQQTPRFALQVMQAMAERLRKSARK